MSVNKTEKQELLEKLNLLLRKQTQFQQEINELQRRIVTLHVDDMEVKTSPTEVVQNIYQVEETAVEEKVIPKIHERPKVIQQKKEESLWEKSGISSEIEKFIGENLINKIGIAIVIIGVGIGVKYAIDNELISPLVRIILGYLVGFGLAGFAIRLKSKYENFSAVLFSGAMAIQYFISYAAYSYYNLFPQMAAIILMVLTTILTVALALYYKQQVIAHFGLVGAYIVPYLLKEPFLNVTILFIYMAIINLGILFISTKKKWKPIIYLAFIATWTIFISWFASGNYNNQLATCLTFLSLFFVIFYLVFLSYKLLLKEKFDIDDIVLLLINSGILYIVGYIAINTHEGGKEFLGLFTLINAGIHGVSTFLIYKTKPADKNLFYWTVGMVIAFFTVTISVQFNDFVTAIIWSVEAALVFLFGKSKKINVYEIISWILIFLTAVITLLNWSATSYNLNAGTIDKLYTPVFNMGFLASFTVITSFCFIFLVNLKSKRNDTPIYSTDFFDVAFPLLFLFIIYFTFFTEISLYWSNIQVQTSFEINADGIWEKQFGNLNPDITKFMAVWLINYSLFFASILSFINFSWLKNKNFDAFLLVINVFLMIIFLTAGLNQIAQLRNSYLATVLVENYDVSIYHLLIRYISIAFFSLLMYSTYMFVVKGFPNKIFKNIFEVILSTSIVWICSSELITWLSLNGSNELYKHWLSILWGVFSLILVSYGIWKKKKHLRIFAIALFTGTLLKLFFYDLTNLETVPKTIVFLFTGVLLLIVSFLYNKYTKMIFEE